MKQYRVPVPEKQHLEEDGGRTRLNMGAGPGKASDGGRTRGQLTTALEVYIDKIRSDAICKGLLDNGDN